MQRRVPYTDRHPLSSQDDCSGFRFSVSGGLDSGPGEGLSCCGADGVSAFTVPFSRTAWRWAAGSSQTPFPKHARKQGPSPRG